MQASLEASHTATNHNNHNRHRPHLRKRKQDGQKRDVRLGSNFRRVGPWVLSQGTDKALHKVKGPVLRVTRHEHQRCQEGGKEVRNVVLERRGDLCSHTQHAHNEQRRSGAAAQRRSQPTRKSDGNGVLK